MIEPYFETELGKLYHGDCLDVMNEIEQVDLIIADPPYNFTTASAGSGKINPWADICNSSLWFSTWQKIALRKLEIKQGALWNFCNWRTLATITKSIFDIKHQIESLMIWNKCWIGPGGPRGLRPSYELVALVCHSQFKIANRGIYDIQEFPWSGIKPSGHPAEKPIDLITYLIKISGGDIIMDPFLGSGTTAIACEKLNRKWIGIEMSKEYCEMAVDRIKKETAQYKMDFS